MFEKIYEIYKSRELLKNLTMKELKLKYKNSVLGFLWSFINPLMMMVVYTIVFDNILKSRLPNDNTNFSVFILSGILVWTFFQTSIITGTHSIVGNAALIKKVYFPREIIPLSIIFSAFLNYLNNLVILFFALIVFGVPITFNILLLPVVLVLLLGFTIGLTLILSALNVYYRDVAHFIEVIFMAWMYLTPIVYSEKLILNHENFKFLLYINPMSLVVVNLRKVVVYGQLPDLMQMIILAAYSIVFLIIGFKVFDKLHKNFAEEI